MMNLLFFFSTAIVYVLWLYYFVCFGAKLDDSKDIVNSWGVLFIPIYIGEVPLFVFCILYGMAQKTTKCNKIKIIVFSLIVYCNHLYI